MNCFLTGSYCNREDECKKNGCQLVPSPKPALTTGESAARKAAKRIWAKMEWSMTEGHCVAWPVWQEMEEIIEEEFARWNG